jgi:hypothetical protein
MPETKKQPSNTAPLFISGLPVLQSKILFLNKCDDMAMKLEHRFFADILLTPLEATRIRLVSERGYATGLVSGFTRLAREGGVRELYAGFLPILCK